MGHCTSCFKSEDKNDELGATEHKVQSRNRPLMRRESIAKRSQIRTIPLDSDAPNAEVTAPQKRKPEKKLIRQALRGHSLFSTLSSEHIEYIIDQMKLFKLYTKETVFSQGQPGYNFFIVSTGRLQVVVNSKSKGVLAAGDSFGELALINGSPRTATVQTLEPTTLWGIDRGTFSDALRAVSTQKYREIKEFLDNIPLFSKLTSGQKDELLGVLVPQNFTDGQEIVSEGDPGDLFYIIKEGTVRCLQNDIELREMGKGECFGEQALLYNTERTATVKSTGKTTVLTLGRKQLKETLGRSLQGVIYLNTQRIALEQSKYLKNLTDNQFKSVILQMEISSFDEGSVVVEEGTSRTAGLYIVLEGKLLGLDENYSVHNCICASDIYNQTENSFKGALLADTACLVSYISSEKLAQCIGGELQSVASRNEAISILKTVPLLRCLPQDTIEKITTVLERKQYAPQEVIFREGDIGDAFYIVKEGNVDILINGHWVRGLDKNSYFGERAILLNEHRTATVTAQNQLQCWVLNKNDFLNLVEEGVREQLVSRMALQDDKIELNELSYSAVLGKGTFGIVILTSHSRKQVSYALKAVSREKIAGFGIHECLLLERDILLQLDHPFIVKLVKTFKDERRVYFLMEHVQGKDLFDVIRVLNLVPDQGSKFYIGCLLLVLEHLHSKRIIYRDLKPENIIIGTDGYPKVIDFGCSKIVPGRTFTIVGTPHYMAPEVIIGKGYSVSADYWSLGIMLFEFLYGFVPFGEEEDNPHAIYKKVLESSLVLPRGKNVKEDAKEVILLLIMRSPNKRGSYRTLKECQWLRDLSWDRLLGKQLSPPHRPRVDQVVIRKDKGKDIWSVFSLEEAKDHAQLRKKPIPAPQDWDRDF